MSYKNILAPSQGSHFENCKGIFARIASFENSLGTNDGRSPENEGAQPEAMVHCCSTFLGEIFTSRDVNRRDQLRHLCN